VISGERTAAFIIACVAIILAPGPSVMFVVARAVAWGRATAWLTALGNAFGMLALSVVIALGLGPLFQRSALLLAIVQALGGLYLIWLGIDALRHRRAHVDAMVMVDETKPTTWQVIRQGFMVGILNPKALVFFSAVFPQFVDPAAGSVTVQLLTFGLIFAVLSVLLDGMWGIIVGSSRDWFVTSDQRLLVLRTIGGVVMVVLGVLVLIPLVWSLVSGA
jgi:threonine/homoserine/homoserine lactone efflux protein